MADGRMRKMNSLDIVPGAVVRMVGEQGEVAPFSDSIILGWRPVAGERHVKLARPMAWAATGDSHSTLLLSCEEYEITANRLVETHHVVLTDRGELYTMTRS